MRNLPPLSHSYSVCAWALWAFLFVLTPAASADGIPASAYRWKADLIRNAHFYWSMAAPTATFGAQIHAESGWRPTARSPVGARGLGQIMPATGQFLARHCDGLGAQNSFNPIWSIRGLLCYDRYLFKMTTGGECERMRHVMAGYNAGPGRMFKRWPRETRSYVTRIFNHLEPAYVRAGFGEGSC